MFYYEYFIKITFLTFFKKNFNIEEPSFFSELLMKVPSYLELGPEQASTRRLNDARQDLKEEKKGWELIKQTDVKDWVLEFGFLGKYQFVR